MARKKHEPLTVDRIFNSQTKEMGSATSILSKLFRIVIADLGVRYEDYNRLVNKWLDDPTYGVPNDPKRRSTVRGNLNKEIVRSDMSFRVFLKALSCIGTESFKMTLAIKRKGSKKETIHDINITNLPMLVAQYLQDSPTRMPVEELKFANDDGDIETIPEQEIDDLVSSFQEISEATIVSHRKKGNDIISNHINRNTHGSEDFTNGGGDDSK